MPDERTRAADGIEAMFATHVLAPWMLTDGLLPLLKAAAPSRVINVTSGGQYDQKVPAGDLHMDLARAATRTAVTRSVRQVLADGFDGAHLDMERPPSRRMSPC